MNDTSDQELAVAVTEGLAAPIKRNSTLRAALAEAREWRGIESAPKDGKHIIVAVKINDNPPFCGEAYFEPEDGHQEWYWSGSHWTDATSGEIPAHYIIGWQPLPDPPPKQWQP